MLSPEWQDLLRRFQEGYASYDQRCLALTMVRWDASKQTSVKLGSPPEMDLPVAVGGAEVVEPSGQKVWVLFQACGYTHRPLCTVTTSDGHGGKLTCVTEEEADPTGPCYDSEQAIAAFRLLARAGGALFSPQRVDTMGVVGQHDPEALWGLFLFSRLQDAPSGFTSEQGEG